MLPSIRLQILKNRECLISLCILDIIQHVNKQKIVP